MTIELNMAKNEPRLVETLLVAAFLHGAHHLRELADRSSER
jgi:hypothetical protein